jgi:hypothetical protein
MVADNGVSATEKEQAKQLLDGVVSTIMGCEVMVDCSVLGVGRKSVEQWCFSIGGKNDEGLLTMVFQQWKTKRRNNCWTELFRQ